MKKNMHERLKEIRTKAGFRSAAEAAARFGWAVPTYSAHENGSRGFSIELIEVYAKSFNSDPVWLAFGIAEKREKVANISQDLLHEVLLLVLQNDAAKGASPEAIADLVLEICRYVHRSGSGGLGAVIDFQLEKIARIA